MAQVFVYADSLQDHVVAIVVPDPEKFSGQSDFSDFFEQLLTSKIVLASKVTGQIVAPTDIGSLLLAAADKRVIAAVEKELAGYGDRAKLNGYEKIKAIHISLEPFTMENDLLTPTFKTKRNIATKVYEKELKALYARSKKAEVTYKL